MEGKKLTNKSPGVKIPKGMICVITAKDRRNSEVVKKLSTAIQGTI